MAKKSKQSKEPKARKARAGSGRRQDSITGLYWDVDGIGRLETDKVNSISYEQMQKAAQSLQPYGYTEEAGLSPWDFPITLEVELSKDTLIATNSQSNGNINRTLLKGSFNFSKGRLRSGTITESITYDIYKTSNGIEVNGFAEAYPGGRQLTNPGKYSSFYNALVSPGQPIAEFNSSSSSEYGNKAFFTEYNGGKTFNDGWWQDPFTPNLI